MENIKLLNADCLNVLKQLPNDSVDLIVTDPPYRVTQKGSVRTCTMSGFMIGDKFRSGKVFDNNDIDCSQYAGDFYRVLKDGTHCYVMCNQINLLKMLSTFTNAKFKFIRSIIWDKGNKICNQFYMSQYEYILMFRKGKARPINNFGTSDILRVPNKKTKGEDKKNLHDTEKPIELMRILIENSSNEGELVFDPFMGIGATAIACKQTNRKYLGIELDEKYFKIAEERLNGEI